MRLWQCARERYGKPIPLGSLLVQRRHDAIRHQGLQPAVLPPLLDSSWIAQELGQKHLVVAFQTNCLVRSTALDQTIKNLPRRRSAVDVITQKHLYWAIDRAGSQVGVDARE